MFEVARLALRLKRRDQLGLVEGIETSLTSWAAVFSILRRSDMKGVCVGVGCTGA